MYTAFNLPLKQKIYLYEEEKKKKKRKMVQKQTLINSENEYATLRVYSSFFNSGQVNMAKNIIMFSNSEVTYIY